MVDVAIEDQSSRWRRICRSTVTTKGAHQIRRCLVGGNDLRLDAVVGKIALDEGCRVCRVARWIGRGDADQRRQESNVSIRIVVD